MRIREKVPAAICVKMTDEMNGDTSKKLGSTKDTELKPRTDISYLSEDNDCNNSSRQIINKGLKCRLKNAVENEESHSPGSPNSEDFGVSGGGRLQFFKDGKFILELSHRKEGEKTCWIPVKKKTYWPTPVLPRNEGSTTLSVSDDSSSVQSSPWQRDHCWKQINPKANLSKELEFYLVHRGSRSDFSQVNRRRARKPFNLEVQPMVLNFVRRARKSLPGVKLKTSQKGLAGVLRFLWERALNPNKLEQGILSPRKRILRELERVSLEEASKRQKAKATSRTVSSHSISSILGQDDDSVLRNLLRSPSPEDARPCFPNTSFPAHRSHGAHSTSGGTFFPQLSQNFRSQFNPQTISWRHQSSIPSQIPHYAGQPYSNWPHAQRTASQDATADVPLNLSKNAG